LPQSRWVNMKLLETMESWVEWAEGHDSATVPVHCRHVPPCQRQPTHLTTCVVGDAVALPLHNHNVTFHMQTQYGVWEPQCQSRTTHIYIGLLGPYQQLAIKKTLTEHTSYSKRECRALYHGRQRLYSTPPLKLQPHLITEAEYWFTFILHKIQQTVTNVCDRDRANATTKMTEKSKLYDDDNHCRLILTKINNFTSEFTLT